MKFWYTNATSLNNKQQHIKAQISVDNPDIIMVTETWYNENSVTHIDNYTGHISNRENGVGGGVAIYAKDTLVTIRVSEQLFEEKTVEQVWCCCSTGVDRILLGCIYRPPNSSVEINNKINTIITCAKNMVGSKKYTSLCIAGDLNFPNIEWLDDGSARIQHNCNQSINFIENLNDNYLQQCVYEPTFQTEIGKRTNTVDLIITHNYNKVRDVEICAPLGNIEKAQNVIKWNFELNGNSQESMFNSRQYCYSKGDYAKFNAEMSTTDWTMLFENKTVDESYETFLTQYNNACNRLIPRISNRQGYQKRDPCISDEVKHLTKQKRSIWKRLLASNFKYNSLVIEYKELKIKIKR